MWCQINLYDVIRFDMELEEIPDSYGLQTFRSRKTSTALEWAGALPGMLGASLLAMNIPVSKWGWALFLLSNVVWITYSYRHRMWGHLTQQAVFTCTSFLGLIRYFS